MIVPLSLSCVIFDTAFTTELFDTISWWWEHSFQADSNGTMLLHPLHVTLKSLNTLSIRLDGLVNVDEIDSWRQVQPGQVKDGEAAIEMQQLQQSSVLQGKISMGLLAALEHNLQVTSSLYLSSASCESLNCGMSPALDLMCAEKCRSATWVFLFCLAMNITHCARYAIVLEPVNRSTLRTVLWII